MFSSAVNNNDQLELAMKTVVNTRYDDMGMTYHPTLFNLPTFFRSVKGDLLRDDDFIKSYERKRKKSFHST